MRHYEGLGLAISEHKYIWWRRGCPVGSGHERDGERDGMINIKGDIRDMDCIMVVVIIIIINLLIYQLAFHDAFHTFLCRLPLQEETGYDSIR
jgi:hypothetical protein